MGYSSVNVGQFPILTAFPPGTLVAQTNAAVSGTYYISASALLRIGATDVDGFCYDTTVSRGSAFTYSGSDVAGHFQPTSITDVITVNAGDAFQLWCYSFNGDGSSSVFNAGLTATLIDSASDASKKGHAHVHSGRPDLTR